MGVNKKEFLVIINVTFSSSVEGKTVSGVEGFHRQHSITLLPGGHNHDNFVYSGGNVGGYSLNESHGESRSVITWMHLIPRNSSGNNRIAFNKTQKYKETQYVLSKWQKI